MANEPEADRGENRSSETARDRVQHLCAKHHVEDRPQRQQESAAADCGNGDCREQAFGGDVIDQRADGKETPRGPSDNCCRDRRVARIARRPRTNGRASTVSATRRLALPAFHKAAAASLRPKPDMTIMEEHALAADV